MGTQPYQYRESEKLPQVAPMNGGKRAPVSYGFERHKRFESFLQLQRKAVKMEKSGHQTTGRSPRNRLLTDRIQRYEH